MIWVLTPLPVLVLGWVGGVVTRGSAGFGSGEAVTRGSAGVAGIDGVAAALELVTPSVRGGSILTMRAFCSSVIAVSRGATWGSRAGAVVEADGCCGESGFFTTLTADAIGERD